MKIVLALAAAALMLAGSTLAAPGDAPYRAVGSEPGWTLAIDHSLIRYVGDHGRTRVTTSVPVPRASFNGHRYETQRITVDITHAPCNDGMSDREYADRVMVTVGRKTVRGCGGDPITSAADLGSSSWSIAAIDGRPVRLDRPTSVRFTDNRIEGRAGCNSFGGTYRLTRNMLAIAEMVSTQMACRGAGMATEKRFFQILDQPVRVQWQGGDTLTLSGQTGSIRLSRAR